MAEASIKGTIQHAHEAVGSGGVLCSWNLYPEEGNEWIKTLP